MLRISVPVEPAHCRSTAPHRPVPADLPGAVSSHTMRVGILGSGLMGGKLGTVFARAGHEVVFSYARSEQKLSELAREAGAKARPGPVREDGQEADAGLLAVQVSRLDVGA